MQKIRKILRAISEKTALPTNQPIITNNTNFIGPGWRRSNDSKFDKCLSNICMKANRITNWPNYDKKEYWYW